MTLRSKTKELNLLEILRELNPWWETKEIPREKDYPEERFLINEFKNRVEEKRIIALVGPRRVGKTILLYQLIKYLLKEKKINPKQILYLLGDDPEITLFLSQGNFGQIIKTYLREVAPEGRVYIFIDEVHHLEDWEKWLKKFYNLEYQIKFFISGSNTLHIKKKTKESLAGRLLEYVMLPLGFGEFLKFYFSFHPSQKINIPKEIGGNFYQKYYWSTKHHLDFLFLKEKISKVFEHFLLWGGFPEGFSTDSLNLWQEKLREDIIKKQIYYDITKTFEIQNPSLIEKMLYLIGQNQSQVFTYETFLQNLPVRSKETVINYLTYLKESFLVEEVAKFSKKALLKSKKYFLTDPGVVNMILKNKKLDFKQKGLVVESVVQNFAKLKYTGTNFFRDSKGREVDIVVQDKEIPLPIEVKYASRIEKGDLKNILYFMEKYEIKQGLILTQDLIDLKRIKEKEIYFLPVWLFLI